MTYTFKCPACVHQMQVEAENDDDAVGKLMEAGGKHSQEVHPDMKIDMEEMTKMVREQMVKS